MTRRKPTKIQLAVVEQAKKDAQERLQAFMPAIQAAAKKIKEVQDAINPPQKETYYYVPPVRPATAIDVERIVDRKISEMAKAGLSGHDLIYNRKEQLLNRFVGNKKLSYKFGKGKRLPLFDLLYSFKEEYVPTKAIMKDLGCPTKNSIHKLAGGINKRAGTSLNLKEKIVEGRNRNRYR